MKKYAFIVTHDSYLNIFLKIAHQCYDKGILQDVIVIRNFGGLSSERTSVLKSPDKTFYEIYLSEIRGIVLKQRYDAVFIGAPGRAFAKIFNIIKCCSIESGRNCQLPKIISAFPGLTLFDQYWGMYVRRNSDVILFNSKKNFGDYKEFCREFNLDSSNALLFGFPQLLEVIPRKNIRKPARTVLFVDGSIVPKDLFSRTYISEKIVQYSRIFPERRVIVLTRKMKDEKAMHPEVYAMGNLVRMVSSGKFPPNLEVLNGEYQAYLEEVDLCLGICSTVMIEAMARGIPTAVISDIGVKEEMGNHYFVGSNCFRSFESLFEDNVPPRPDAGWFEHVVTQPDQSSVDEMLDRISASNNLNLVENEEIFYLNKEGRGYKKILAWMRYQVLSSLYRFF